MNTRYCLSGCGAEVRGKRSKGYAPGHDSKVPVILEEYLGGPEGMRNFMKYVRQEVEQQTRTHNIRGALETCRRGE